MATKRKKTETKLTHTDEGGKAKMVDIGSKAPLARRASARGMIRMSPETLHAVRENRLKKGDVLAVARIAGVQAAKSTPALIPLCHTLVLESVSLEFRIREKGVEATCEVSCEGKTGVEMEALTGVSVALLTIYDMCKALDRKMRIDGVALVFKEKNEL